MTGRQVFPERVEVIAPHGFRAFLRAAAETEELSIADYIRQTLAADMRRKGLKPPDAQRAEWRRS